MRSTNVSSQSQPNSNSEGTVIHSLRPRDDTGRAWSQAPEALDLTASNLVRSVSSSAEASKVEASKVVRTESHLLCKAASSSCGGLKEWPCDHKDKAESAAGVGKQWREGMMAETKS